MSKDTGGPAFPQDVLDFGSATICGQEPGLSIRDYFAAKAMQGMCASLPNIVGKADYVPRLAYEMADAMLKARSE